MLDANETWQWLQHCSAQAMIKCTLIACINSCLSHTKTLWKNWYWLSKCILFVFVWGFCLFVCFGFCALGFLFLLDFVSVLFLVGFCLVLFLFVFLFAIKFPSPVPPPSPQWNLGVEEEDSEKCSPMKSVEGLFFLTERSLDFPGVTLPFMHNSGFVTTETASKCQVTKDDRKTH